MWGFSSRLWVAATLLLVVSNLRLLYKSTREAAQDCRSLKGASPAVTTVQDGGGSVAQGGSLKYDKVVISNMKEEDEILLEVSQRQVPMTIFSAPRGFDQDTSARQRSAIVSWKMLPGHVQGLLFGNEPGVEEMAHELGFLHSNAIQRDEQGIPIMDSMFRVASKMSPHQVMCYINADISLPPAWYRSLQLVLPWVLAQERPFLIAGPRLLFPQEVMWTVNESFVEWEKRNAALFTQVVIDGAIDWFVYRRGDFDKMPPFKLGRYVWDAWMVAQSTQANWVSVTTFTKDRSPQHVYGIHWEHSRHHQNSKKSGAAGRSEENWEIVRKFGGLHPEWGRLRGQELGLVVKPNGDHVIKRRFDYEVLRTRLPPQK